MSISKKNNITIIIVNYNSSNNANRLINSLKLIKKYISQIIIIDNNSNDVNNLVINNKIILIKNKKNLGFAKAVNQGIKLSKNNIILLINPDCYLENSSITRSLERIIENHNIGAIGGKIKKPNSNSYHLTANTKPNFLTGLFEFTNLKKIFPNNTITKKFWVEKIYRGKDTKYVNSLCGAYIIFRKKLNNKLNLFDERFFLYMEDIDFGNSINQKGYKVVFDPNSEITHIGGASSDSKYNTVLKHWYNSRKKYFQKHLNPIESLMLTIIFTLEEQFLKIYHKIKAEPYE